MDIHNLWGQLFFIELALRLYFIIRIVTRRLPIGVSWAWISFLLSAPVVGTIAYLYLGEYRLGWRRTRRIEAAKKALRHIEASWSKSWVADLPLSPGAQLFAKSVQKIFDAPAQAGHRIQLLQGADEAFPEIIGDIEKAQTSCDFEFYIWSPGGRADEVGHALIRACQRNVACRLIVDQIGSADFLKSSLCQQMRSAGVVLTVALPSGIWRSLFTRPDLRLHRKIILIDRKIAYTGSLNMADPLYFNKGAGVGPWVDAFCKIQGPVVCSLESVFLSDWASENNIDLNAEKPVVVKDLSRPHKAILQCLPSGPALQSSSIEQSLISAIYTAQKKLILTTPYFVPDERLYYALLSAAAKGVEVTLIIPEKVDSKLVQYASQAFLRDLAQGGVNVALFTGGLLHTKSVTIDDEFALFGSLNLDPRSLRINFEITLAIYDKDFVGDLENLQRTYLKSCKKFEAVQPPSQVQKLKEDFIRLASPLL